MNRKIKLGYNEIFVFKATVMWSRHFPLIFTIIIMLFIKSIQRKFAFSEINSWSLWFKFSEKFKNKDEEEEEEELEEEEDTINYKWAETKFSTSWSIIESEKKIVTISLNKMFRASKVIDWFIQKREKERKVKG